MKTMKKLILIAIAFGLAGCGTTNFTLVRKPAELERFSFIKDADGVVMVERATGETKALTKDQVKRINKLQPAAARVYADRLFN